MQCPVCASAKTRVVDSRDGKDASIRRRRVCEDCGHRFTTRERIEEVPPVVQKRDGTKQPFDRGKLRRGLELACRKRPITPAKIDEIVGAVERWAMTRGDRELSAEGLGLRVMHELYRLDHVAYVRFVSVYRSFGSVREFAELLAEMEKAERVDREGQRSLFEGEPDPERALPGSSPAGPRSKPVA